MLVLAALLFYSTNADAQCTPIGQDDSLVGHWKLDESSGTFADSSGNGYDGTESGGVAYASGGFIGPAAGFDAVDDIIDTTLTDLSGAMTLSAWIYPRSEGENNGGRIIDKGSTVMLHLGGALNVAFERRFDAVTAWTNADILVLNKWQHLAVVYDDSSVNNDPIFYHDGVPYAHTWTGGPPTGVAFNNATTVAIGNGVSLSRTFDGQIDDVRIYNRILSAAEIKALYAQRSNAAPQAGQIVYNTRNSLMQYCDGTNWRVMGTGSYNPVAVYFDGTNDYLQAATLTGIVDSKLWTVSTWFKRGALSTAGDQNVFDTSTSDQSIEFEGTAKTDGLLVIDADGGTVLDVDVAVVNDTSWHHLLFSFDMASTATRKIYLDDIDVTGSATFVAYVDSVIDFDGAPNYGLGASVPSATSKYTGDIADFWYDAGTFLDLSIESNRRKFISANGMPMYLGPDGSIPTGSAPDIFLSGDVIYWQSNKGTGGDFAENGELTYATSQPGDVILTSAGRQQNYFVVTSGTWDGALGGYDGAHDKCHTDLNANDWLNKPNGTIPKSMVRAWICAGDNPSDPREVSNCYQALPATTYTFAASGEASTGGATFTTDSSGRGPNDSTAWNLATTFGTTTKYVWAGRDTGSATLWPVNNGCNCTNFTLSTGAGCSNSGNRGNTSSTTAGRWQGGSFGCDGVRRLYCLVDVPSDACTNTLGIKGQLQYNPDFNVMEYCNGVEWVAMGAVGGTPPSSGLVGHWKLDESGNTSTAVDSAGSNNGTLTNFAADPSTSWQNAMLGNGLEFDGSDDVVLISDNAAFSGLSAITISAWVYPHQWKDRTCSTGCVESILVKSNHADQKEFRMRHSDGDAGTSFPNNHIQLSFSVDGSASVETMVPESDVPVNEWTLIIGTWDTASSELKMYINGVLKDTQTLVGASLFDSNSNLAIGNSGDQAGGLKDDFDGLVDDVRIYNRALSAQEIQQLYYYGLSGGLGDVSGNCSTPSRPEGTLIYNTDENILQYCNGENWVGIGK
jgi:hypothetical protein